LVTPQQYLEVLRQLRLSNPDCPMPSDSEVVAAIGDNGSTNFTQFVRHIFKVTALQAATKVA
jgi:hypothetical protein